MWYVEVYGYVQIFYCWRLLKTQDFYECADPTIQCVDPTIVEHMYSKFDMIN